MAIKSPLALGQEEVKDFVQNRVEAMLFILQFVSIRRQAVISGKSQSYRIDERSVPVQWMELLDR